MSPLGIQEDDDTESKKERTVQIPPGKFLTSKEAA
jgi:hypothetical protein